MNNDELSVFLNEEGIIHYKAGKTAEAMQYWNRAAEMGCASAMFNIGILMMNDRVSHAELSEARMWFGRAHELGHRNAAIQIEKIDNHISGKNPLPERVTDSKAETVPQYKRVNIGGCNWFVLHEEQDECLCLTENIIAIYKYSENAEPVAWESSYIREWLNTVFLNELSDNVKSIIIEKKLINADNPLYGTSGGSDTYDRIFLLSLDEIRMYMTSEGESMSFDKSADLLNTYKGDYLRKAYLDMNESRIESARIQCGHDYSMINGQSVGWWLRSPGKNNLSAMRINCNGTIRIHGREADHNLVGVRPAMWIRKEECKWVIG